MWSSLHGLRINLVVFLVRPNQPDHQHSMGVLEIAIPFYGKIAAHKLLSNRTGNHWLDQPSTAFTSLRWMQEISWEGFALVRREWESDGPP
jgi:DNA transposition AAA+ family ATPase